METSKLRIFVAIAKTESIRKAAEITNLSPSAVSKIFHQVEDEIGVPLLIPMGRGMTLTPEGRKLAENAERLLAEIDDLKRGIVSMSEEKLEAPIRIATFEVFSTYFLQTLENEKLRDRKLVLHETLPGELEQAVASRKADFGITYMPVPFPEVEHVKVARLEMGTFRKIGAFEGMPLEELPFVVPAMPLQGTPSRNHGLDGWPLDAFRRRIVYEVTLMESALELCRQGRCAGYFPVFIVQLHNLRLKAAHNLVRHVNPKKDEACFTDAYLVKRKDVEESRDFKLLSKLLRQGTKS